MSNEIVCWLIGFLIFTVVQALVINGVHYCFAGGCVQEMNKGKICKGGVFYMINPAFFEKHKGKWWTYPIYACVRCQSSFWGGLTYWPFILYTFGFRFWEIPVFICNVFCLVSITYFIYKKL